MILEFIGNAPRNKYLRVGVSGNNLVDDLVFIITRKQGKVDLYEFTPKIKITTPEGDFAEYSGDDLEFEKIEDKDTVRITYVLPEKVTERGNVDMQIVFEKSLDDGTDKVWQTLPFNVTFPESIDESGSLIKAYPNIVRELKADAKKAVDDSATAVDTANAAKLAAESVVGIDSIEQTTLSDVDGENNEFTITLTNGDTTTFVVKNGNKGDKGEQGIQGEKGEKGDTGATGPQGPKGDTGAIGPQGVKGDTGSSGADGKDGADGTSVTVSSVEESTADGGSNIVKFSDGKTLTIKNGSKGSQGEKGEKGEQGIQGEKGDTGADGASIIDVAELPTENINDGTFYRLQNVGARILTLTQSGEIKYGVVGDTPARINVVETLPEPEEAFETVYLQTSDMTPYMSSGSEWVDLSYALKVIYSEEDATIPYDDNGGLDLGIAYILVTKYDAIYLHSSDAGWLKVTNEPIEAATEPPSYMTNKIYRVTEVDTYMLAGDGSFIVNIISEVPVSVIVVDELPAEPISCMDMADFDSGSPHFTLYFLTTTQSLMAYDYPDMPATWITADLLGLRTSVITSTSEIVEEDVVYLMMKGGLYAYSSQTGGYDRLVFASELELMKEDDDSGATGASIIDVDALPIEINKNAIYRVARSCDLYLTDNGSVEKNSFTSRDTKIPIVILVVDELPTKPIQYADNYESPSRVVLYFLTTEQCLYYYIENWHIANEESMGFDTQIITSTSEIVEQGVGYLILRENELYSYSDRISSYESLVFASELELMKEEIKSSCALYRHQVNLKGTVVDAGLYCVGYCQVINHSPDRITQLSSIPYFTPVVITEAEFGYDRDFFIAFCSPDGFRVDKLAPDDEYEHFIFTQDSDEFTLDISDNVTEI